MTIRFGYYIGVVLPRTLLQLALQGTKKFVPNGEKMLRKQLDQGKALQGFVVLAVNAAQNKQNEHFVLVKKTSGKDFVNPDKSRQSRKENARVHREERCCGERKEKRIRDKQEVEALRFWCGVSVGTTQEQQQRESEAKRYLFRWNRIKRSLVRCGYQDVAIQIKVILEAHGLWEAIESKDNTEVDIKKDKATIAFLYQALTEDVILKVAGWETAKELWDSLKTRHVGEEKVQQARLQSLMIGFNTLQMKDDDTVDAFTAKLNGYAMKAKELGKTLDESLLVRKLLDSTPDRFIQIVASIEQTSDLDEITLDEITRKLKAFEERIKLQKEGQVESQENLLFAQGEHSGKGRRFSKRGGRSNFSRGNWQNNRNRNNSQGGNSNHKGNSNKNKGEWDLSKVRCFKCQNLGHLRKDCRGTSTTQEQSNLILEEDEPSLLMTTHEEVLLNEGQIQPEKYNGASNHMTGVKSHFRDIDESVTGRVRFGDGSYVQIMGRGSIVLG
ncbi:zinc finger, CCHC-type containing protein, partial [Tanacetum coccineum]